MARGGRLLASSACLFFTTGAGPGKHDRLAAGLFDLFLGRFAEAVGRDLELLGQLAVAQELQLVEAALGEVLGHEAPRA